MALEKIFKLIRKGDVVLWAGSGFSKYAGYPMGGELAKILYNELSETEKVEVTPNPNLQEMAEEFLRFNLGKRNHLVRILKEHYGKKPLSIKYHSILSTIPHFKTIITTNYDSLFELAYKDSAQVFFNNNNLSYKENEKTEIFKIHGDLSDPDSILISKDDYENHFLKKNEADIFWTVVTERISVNAILFIGYNLDDININVIFKNIKAALGKNEKEKYLIAPNLSTQKRNSLIQNGIQYLNMNGEEFVEQLLKNIKKNITHDFKKKWVPIDAFTKFMNLNNLTPLIQLSGDIQSLVSITTKEGILVNSKVKLSILEGKDDARNKLTNFISGKIMDELIIERNEIKDFDILMSGISLVDMDSMIEKLILKRMPNKEGSVRVLFQDLEEFENLSYKLFQTNKEIIIIQLQLRQAKLKIELAANKGTEYKIHIEYEIEKEYSSVNNALFNFKFLFRIYSGYKFTVYFPGVKEGVEMSPKPDNPISSQLVATIQYLNDLKTIESYYKIYFQNINENDFNLNTVNKLISLINTKSFTKDWDGTLRLGILPEFSLTEFESYMDKDFNLAFSEEANECITLHQEKINLGYPLIIIHDPYIIDSSEVDGMNIGSRSKKMTVIHTDKPLDHLNALIVPKQLDVQRILST